MAEMQKQGKPTDQKADEWQKDLNPDPMAGQNHGLETAASEKEAPTAYDIKALHTGLQEFSDLELKRITILPQGTRLKQGATYLNLSDRQTLTALGNMEAEPDSYYVPKTEIDYELWNRLTEVQDPDRLDQPAE